MFRKAPDEQPYQFYLRTSERPLTEEEIRKGLADGILRHDTLVRRGGDDQWQELWKLPAFQTDAMSAMHRRPQRRPRLSAHLLATGFVLPDRRHLPASTRLVVLLGGVLHQSGWALMLVSLLSAYLLPHAALESYYDRFGTWVETEGTVQQVSKSISARSRDKHYDSVYYGYAASSGRHHRGVTTAATGKMHLGDKLRVEYLARDPTRSRRVGETGGIEVLSATLLLVVLFVVGLVLVVVQLRAGLLGWRVLQRGKLATATVESRVQSKLAFERGSHYRGTLRYGVAEDTFETKVWGATTVFPEKDQKAPVLYIEATPRRALAPDFLPGRWHFELDGRITAESWPRAAAVLLLPAVTVTALCCLLVG